MNNSSPVGWPHSHKCMPVSCRLWVYGSYIHIDAQFMFTQHEAYWIQDTPVEVSTKGRQVHQRAIGLLIPCFPIRPCACRRTWKTSFEVTGWWLTICGSPIILVLRGTLHPLNMKGGQSLLFSKVAFQPSKSSLASPFFFCRVHPWRWLVMWSACTEALLCFRVGGSLTHLGAGSRTNPSHLVPVPHWLSLLLVANHPKGSLYVIRTHLVLKAMKNKKRGTNKYFLGACC